MSRDLLLIHAPRKTYLHSVTGPLVPPDYDPIRAKIEASRERRADLLRVLPLEADHDAGQ